MAFVLVQHLDPTHESHLVELIAKVSHLPIVEARDNLPIEPDHVYVIPPDTSLTIAQGVLHLQPRPAGRGVFMPVDGFFAALAEDRRSQAIGVVLSGTGSDGTLGVKAIKAEGGITFAQDATAQHDGMPRSAVASECVDFVLAPDRIARELVRISSHPYLNGGQAGDALQERGQDEAALQQLFQQLRKATRVEYANYKRSTILRRIQRRLLLHRLDRLDDYLRFIKDHPDELPALHQDLLIHVTRFFRDPPAFAALAAKMFPTLAKDRPVEEPIRVWVPGCSTGEEVYSLAICLLEFLGDSARPIKIFATDVSELALERARTGKYLENIATDVSEERLRRWFVKEASGYQISKTIRDMCVFARHDMTNDPPFSNLDLISCRNVLIYLGPVLQKRVMPVFHYALRDQGFLLLGGSETIGTLTDLFTVVDAKQRIYTRKATPSRLMFDFTGGSDPTFARLPSPHRPGNEAVSGLDIQREADRAVLAHYAPPGVVVNDEMDILQSRGQTGSFLALGPGTASLNLFKMAREGLLLDLRAAIEEARRTGTPTRREGLRVRANGHYLNARVQVIPVTIGKQRCFNVLFEAAADTVVPPAADGAVPEPTRSAEEDRQVNQLQQELAGTKDYLQSIIEQLEGANEELKAANEEILSSNEELQSTNEELQTAKEELQATNEELNTVNEELQHQNREAKQLSDDLTNLFRSVNIPIVMVGQDLKIRRFTPSAAALFNFIMGDVGRPIGDIKSRLDAVDLRQRILKVLETLVMEEEEVCDQQGRWHHLCIRPYRSQDSRIDGAVISVVDIDALKRSEQTIRHAKEYAESVINTVQVPLLVLDAELRVVSGNSSCHEVFRTTAGDLEKRYLVELFDRQWDAPGLLQLLRAAFAEKKPFKDVEVGLNLPVLGARTMQLDGRLLLRSEQEPPLLLLRAMDVTQSRRLESDLRQAQKMEAVGLLAAGIAHDFNNLLTVIAGYCAVLQERLSADGPGLEMITKISESGERAANLTRQLLAFSRKSILAPKVLDLGALIRAMETILTRLLGPTITIQSRPAPGLGRVFADPALIEQVILNLAMNARDAMPQGGDLFLEASDADLDDAFTREHPDVPPGRYVLLTVRDTGNGMDAPTLARVFEPFYTTKEVGKGTGLGLASVHGSVKQSGGFILVSSQPNQGTEFSIYLPRLAAAPAPAKAVPAVSPRGAETLLLVDDTSEVRRLARLVLEDAGYTVLEAENGSQALAVAQAHPDAIHLLVTDVVMPKMNGRQLAGQLLAVRPELKVLYLSGYTDSVLVRTGIEKSALAFLQKPYSPLALTQKVREVLDAK